ncbi:Serine/threonine protein kinase [Actinacidiphila yanglinensis]|uniref:non-specific serine/threonine protein kinase n=1 Tax=Actinacidiphila yanglinensis TaxID=310779 RepID=A0A1H6DXX7_9ACTN|nr:serine/threonine-protein kinase [Actinacidiphila yanglinensis]SEG90192.1 Serine/threonine protein kinase [Actinacidiphila yanglinensis]
MAAGHHDEQDGPGGAPPAGRGKGAGTDTGAGAGRAPGKGAPAGAGGTGSDSTLIQGRYRLHELIGRGGMGEVWRALDESLGRKVAVKCLKPMGQSGDAGFNRILQERFRREARVAAALQHRGITVVHDFGEHDGVLFLVMELLDGRNLLQVLDDARRHPLPVPDLTDIAEQVADALAYTHAQGVVHRDLKPANIIRLADGGVKICDFGIARLGHDIGFTSRLTGTGVAMGTPHYMSPEQISNSGVDQRSDLYSLGCVLYELATGHPPFDLGDAWSILVGHRDNIPEPPRAERPELPADLEGLILDLLAKDPEDRPQNAADVAGRLKAIRAGAKVAVPAGTAVPGWARALSTGPVARSTRVHPPVEPAHHELTGAWSTRTVTASADPAALAELAARQAEADDLGRIGNWHQAYDLHTTVATSRDRAQGTEHPDTLASRHEAAYCLTRLGRAEEALRLYAYVAEVRRRVLGPDDPDTLAARHEAAYALGALGRHLEAHQEFSAVLAARERVLGPEHPDTLRCKHNLAFNLGQLGRAQEAYTTAVEVADARSRVLGPEHTETLGTRFEVGFTLGQAGRWAEALEVYREVGEARARVLGADHPDTLAVRYETGICLTRLGCTADALTLYEDLVAALTRASGSSDEETLRARQALGVNLGRLGHWDRALAEARDVAAVRQRVLGGDHPDTLVSKREIAVCLGWLGRWSDALTVYREVADAREELLGADDPDTLTSRNDQARCLEHLGRSEEAQELYRRVSRHRQDGPERL